MYIVGVILLLIANFVDISLLMERGLACFSQLRG